MSFQKLLSNAKEYIGVDSISRDELDAVMTTIVEKYGKDIYLKPSALAKSMEEFGASDIQIKQITLMIGVAGFRDLLEKDARIQQADLSRYVSNALQETGLTRSTILALTSSIAFSLDIAFDYTDREQRDLAQKSRKAYAIPVSIYESELIAFERLLSGTDTPIALTDTQMERLRVLSDAGISQAKYYLGKCILLEAKKNGTEPQTGIRYLEEAAEDAYPPAAAALGDYYYFHQSTGDWSRAYDYYTRFGSAAFTPSRQIFLRNILNHGTYNKGLIGSSLLFFATMLLCVIVAPGAVLFAAHRVIGGFCLVGSAALIVLAWMHYRVNPYDNFYWLPLGLHTFWFLYMVLRIIW